MSDHKLFIDKILQDLVPECKNCFALCCVALHFTISEGFPINKKAGQPCINLRSDFCCSIHSDLIEKGFKGCTIYECLGAGQKVAQITFCGQYSREDAYQKKLILEIFLMMKQLHELLWYLVAALQLKQTQSFHCEIKFKIEEIELLTQQSADQLLKTDISAFRDQVNILLRKTSDLVRTEAVCNQNINQFPISKKSFDKKNDFMAAELKNTDLVGADLRGACLIATDLRGTDLSGADLIGADLRDADLRGADLSESLFLTQVQVNSAKGNYKTKLPLSINRPNSWQSIK